MGGTPLRDLRGGRLLQSDHKALLISSALIYARRIGQVQVGPRETNLIRPNTPRHYELKPPASIVQLNGTVQANIYSRNFILSALRGDSAGTCWNTIKYKNALTEAVGLACLKIRSRNEETINSKRNRIYLLKAFYFLLY